MSTSPGTAKTLHPRDIGKLCMPVENYLSGIILIASHPWAIGKLCLYVDNLWITFRPKTAYITPSFHSPSSIPATQTIQHYTDRPYYARQTSYYTGDTVLYSATQHYTEKIYPVCTHALRIRSMFSRVSRFLSLRVSGSMFSRVPEKNL